MVASRVTTISQTVEQVWAKGQGNALLVNTDLTNPLYVSQSNVISANDISIPPLGSMSVDGNSNWYASSLSGAIKIATQIAPGVTQWTPSPAQVAAQINALGLAKDTTVAGTTTAVAGVNATLGSPAQDSTVQSVKTNTTGVAKDSSLGTINGTLGSPAQDASVTAVKTTLGTPAQDSIRTAIPNNISTTGVPLLNKSAVVVSASSGSIAASSNFSSAIFSINQPSFELLIAVSYQVAVGTQPYAFIVLQWIDSTSGLITDEDTFVIPVASNAALNTLPFNIKGPSKGDSLKLRIFNLDTAQAEFATYTLLTNSRIIPTESIRMGVNWKNDGANLTGFTTRVLPDSKVIGTFANSALAANGTDTYVMVPASGIGYFNLQETGVAGANITVIAQPFPTAIYGTTYLINDIMVAGNTNKLNYSGIVMPNGPVQVQIHNGGSVAANYSGMWTVQ